MTVKAFPHEATTTGASVWIGCDEAGPPDLELHWTDDENEPQVRNLVGLERSSPDGQFHYWLEKLDGLPAGPQTVTVRVEGGGPVRASVDVGPLRESLPQLGEREFTVLVGSCFSRQGAAANPTAIRDAMTALTANGLAPDMTILCGDQVYLDDESGNPIEYTPDDYWPALSQVYLDAWGFGPEPSIAPILATGASWFTQDDHEWWNNYPEWAPLVPATYDDCWAQPWAYVARQLIAAFQPTVQREVTAGGLSFHVADTRARRTSVLTSQRHLFDPAELEAVTNWVEDLDRPGVLVLAQPFFQEEAGTLAGTVIDAKLADFGADYGELLAALDARTQPIVIVAGDVHYSRIAKVDESPPLVEVVSSPIAMLPGGLAPALDDAHDPGPASLTPHTLHRNAAPGFMLLRFGENAAGKPEMKIHQVRVETQDVDLLLSPIELGP